MSRLSNDECSYAMHRREEFTNKTGSLTGRWLGSGSAAKFVGLGHLPTSYGDELSSILRRVYVVYSYDTPIAWAPEGEILVVPNVRYSVTTSQHQAGCLKAHRGFARGEDGTYGAIDPITVGQMYDNGTPVDIVRKGKGRSPFGERMGY